MSPRLNKRQARLRRHRRVRRTIEGTQERPRLCVFRSLSHMYAQIINDEMGHTLLAASTLDEAIKAQVNGKTKIEEAKLVGHALAKQAKEQGIEQVVFDRGGRLYHGRVRALAEGAREAGLQF